MDSTEVERQETLDVKDLNSGVKKEFDLSKPPSIGYYVFYLLGLATLLPWNFFITHDSYWAYKFRDVSVVDHVQRGPALNNFYSYLSIASMMPNTLFLIGNAVLGHRVSQRIRMIASMSVIVLMFSAIVLMVQVKSDAWQHQFLLITLLKVAVSSAACAVFQGALFDLAARIPGPYVSAVMSGQGLGAVFSNVCYIVALSMAGSDAAQMALNSALVFFSIAVAVVLAAMASLLWLMRLPYFVQNLGHLQLQDKDEQQQSTSLLSSLTSLLSMIRWQAASVVLVFTVTLSVFPAITVTIQPTWSPKSVWAQNYFRPVACFLLFNVTDFVGRTLAGRLAWPQPQSPKTLMLLSGMRIVLIPLLMLCNVSHTMMTTFFHSDLFYVTFIALLGFSNGYVATVAMTNAPVVVPAEQQGRASAIMIACLGIGLSLGAALSKPLLSLL